MAILLPPPPPAPPSVLRSAFGPHSVLCLWMVADDLWPCHSQAPSNPSAASAEQRPLAFLEVLQPLLGNIVVVCFFGGCSLFLFVFWQHLHYYYYFFLYYTLVTAWHFWPYNKSLYWFAILVSRPHLSDKCHLFVENKKKMFLKIKKKKKTNQCWHQTP